MLTMMQLDFTNPFNFGVQARAGIREVHFLPFNPVDKRTALTYIDAEGHWHRVSKGAPEQVFSSHVFFFQNFEEHLHYQILIPPSVLDVEPLQLQGRCQAQGSHCNRQVCRTRATLTISCQTGVVSHSDGETETTTSFNLSCSQDIYMCLL